ncbi:MAG: hypothetical protein Q8P32_01905 [Candidatus Komeilibacteria bacterium]|nr:hypothetical protein [Candidatus Komeilibacteria bacterium]
MTKLLKKLIRSKAGFTLTEIVSVLTISVAVMIMVYNIFIVSQRVFMAGDNFLEISQNARILLDRLSRELRQTPEIATDLPPDKNQVGWPPAAEIMFQDGHDQPEIVYLRYYLDQSAVYRQRLYYYFNEEPGTKVKWNAVDSFGQPPEQSVIEQKIIAEYVEQIRFYGADLTTIEINLKKNNNASHFLTSIWGRNTRN